MGRLSRGSSFAACVGGTERLGTCAISTASFLDPGEGFPAI